MSTTLTVALTVAATWVLRSVVAPRVVAFGRRRGWTVRNYREREIPFTLGLLWAIWVAGIGLAGAASALVARTRPELSLLVPPAAVLGAALLGLIDDIGGDAHARGFKGHLAELRHGRVTTGLVKMVGIGALSLWAARSLVSGRMTLVSAMVWLLAAGVVSLSANLLNLLDVRPGRALKGYVTYLSAVWLAGLALLLAGGAGSDAARSAGYAGSLVPSMLFLLAPAVASWPYDLAEKATIGDAGANAAGVLAGVELVRTIPHLFALIPAFVLLLGLNLVSERASFSAIIERNRLLRRLDRIGRLPEEPAPSDDSRVPESPSGTHSADSASAPTSPSEGGRL